MPRSMPPRILSTTQIELHYYVVCYNVVSSFWPTSGQFGCEFCVFKTKDRTSLSSQQCGQESHGLSKVLCVQPIPIRLRVAGTFINSSTASIAWYNSFIITLDMIALFHGADYEHHWTISKKFLPISIHLSISGRNNTSLISGSTNNLVQCQTSWMP